MHRKQQKCPVSSACPSISIGSCQEGVDLSGVYDMGTHYLPKGNHELKFRVVGANPNALPGNMFGLDYVRLD